MVNQSLFGLIIPHQILQFNKPLDFGGQSSTGSLQESPPYIPYSTFFSIIGHYTLSREGAN